VKLREKPTAPPKRNVFLYGPPKSGKTLALVSAPGPIALLNADLENATYLAHQRSAEGHLLELDLSPESEKDTPTLRTLLELEQIANARKFGTVQTVGVDPVGELYLRLVRELSGNAISPAIQVYQQAGVFVERLCRALCTCPDVNVVICAHDHPMKDESTESVEVLPYTGSATNPSLGRKIMSMVDVIGFTARVEQADGDPLFMAQLVNAKGRRGGDRFDVLAKKENGYSRRLDLTEWFDALAELTSADSTDTVTSTKPDPGATPEEEK
jgi:hypothetical protein